MPKTRKAFLVDDDMEAEIQAIADDENEGRWNVAARILLREALAARRSKSGIDTSLVGSRPLDHFHPGGFRENEKGQFVPTDGDVRPERGADPFATH